MSHEFSQDSRTEVAELMASLPEATNAASRAIVINVDGRPQGFLLHPNLLAGMDASAILAGARMPAHILREKVRPELVEAFGPGAQPTIARPAQPGERIRPLIVRGEEVANLEAFGDRAIAPLEWTPIAEHPNGGIFSLAEEPSPYAPDGMLSPADRVAAQLAPRVAELAGQVSGE